MKKNLKKMLVMFILVLSMLALAACSSSDDDDDEGGSSRRRRSENVEPTDEPEPTTDPTNVPAPTNEPADTPIPTEPVVTPDQKEEDIIGNGTFTTPSGEPEIIITDVPEPTDEPEPTDDPEPTDEPEPIGAPYYSSSNILEVKYTGFDGIDEKAKSVAAEFGNAFVTGNKETILKTLAYDTDKLETLNRELDEYTGLVGDFSSEIEALGIDPATVDITTLLSINPIGGKTINTAEAVSWMQLEDTYVDDITEWDNFCVISTEMQGSILSLLDYDLSDEGINFVLAERNGEYKVLTATFYEDYGNDDPEPVNNDEDIINIKGKLYQFNGNETADEIIDIFNKGFEDLDFYTMLSCVAVDNDHLVDAVKDNEEAISAFELYKTLGSGLTVSAERGEAQPVDEEELGDVREECETVNDPENITDVVKYDVTYSYSMAGQSDTEIETVYVGKYNGEYRVVKCFIFD
ncbi:MAG: hypothetical protein IK007_11320 [Lachnospiraceae bacterium]|nr:hypothetical protein [Lachnospiraceae bacterium]